MNEVILRFGWPFDCEDLDQGVKLHRHEYRAGRKNPLTVYYVDMLPGREVTSAVVDNAHSASERITVGIGRPQSTGSRSQQNLTVFDDRGHARALSPEDHLVLTIGEAA